MHRKEIRELLAACYGLAVTYMVGRWAIHYAYLERGYDAVGGEYLLIPMVFLVAYKVFEIFINALEEEINGNKKRRGREVVRMRDYRRRFR